MTNKDVLQTAMTQSTIELNCKVEDFLQSKNVITDFYFNNNFRKYYKEPISANLVSYGNNIVATTNTELKQIVSEYISKFDFYHCFESPNLDWLYSRIDPLGYKPCFMAEYFLPKVDEITKIAKSRATSNYKTKLLTQDSFSSLYETELWQNALCSKRAELDVLGVGAYDGEKLIGLAGCSADCDSMWQIGVDVLPEYRQKGIASTLVSNLSYEILQRGKVPFYCCAWSNIRSCKTAIKSGFATSWVELTIKPSEVVDKMNEDAK